MLESRSSPRQRSTFSATLTTTNVPKDAVASEKQTVSDFSVVVSYDKMLELYPKRVNPLSLWLSAHVTVSNERSFLMRQLQLIAHGEPSQVIELKTVPEPPLGQDDVLVSMEARQPPR